MKEGLSFFLSKTGISVIKDEPDGSKEIAFPRTVPANNDIMSRTERFNNDLVLVRFETLNCELHGHKFKDLII